MFSSDNLFLEGSALNSSSLLETVSLISTKVYIVGFKKKTIKFGASHQTFDPSCFFEALGYGTEVHLSVVGHYK